MGVLIAAQWRALFPSVWIWTLVAMGEVVLHAHGVRNGLSAFSLIPMAHMFLAAALGTRALTFDSRSGTGTWLGALPLHRGRLVLLRLGFSFACLLGSVLATVGFLFAARAFGWLGASVEPSGQQWVITSYLLPCILLSSAYFASSFEHAGASLQAGIPGFMSGIEISSVALLPRPWSFMALVGILALALLAICRLQARRGIDGSSPDASLLRDLRPMDRVIVLPAQLLFVVLPLVLFWSDLLRVPAPYLQVTTLQASIVFWVAVGILAAPWGWRDLGARGLRGVRRLAGLALIATGVGVFPWRMVRRRGVSIACASCGRKRVCSIPFCPRCGESEPRPGPSLKLSRLVPKTPASLLFSSITLLIGGGCLFGGQRYVHAFDIQSDLPGVEIRLGERVVPGGRLSGWVPGVRLGSLNGGWSDAVQGNFDLAESLALPITVQEFAHQLARNAPVGAERLPPTHEYLPLALGAQTEIEVSCKGQPCFLVHNQGASLATRSFVVGTNVYLQVECPALEAFLTELQRANAAGTVSSAQLDDAVQWGDALFYRLFERRGVTHADLARSRALYDALVDRRGRIESATPELVFRHLDETLDWLRQLSESRHSTFGIRLPYLAADIRALGHFGERAADELRERIARDEATAVLVAGVGRDASCWDACEDYARRASVAAQDDETRYAVWTLLMLDGPRALPILEEILHETKDESRIASLVRLIGRSDQPEVTAWLRREILLWTASKRESAANEDSVEMRRLGFTLDDYFF